MVRSAKRALESPSLSALSSSVSAERVYSVVILGGALTLLAQDRVHPALMYCLQLFLAL
jgi:hypothetical protein